MMSTSQFLQASGANSQRDDRPISYHRIVLEINCPTAFSLLLSSAEHIVHLRSLSVLSQLLQRP